MSAAFDEIADLLEIENANPLRVRAYRNASRIVSGLPAEAAQMIAEGRKLTDFRGIGEDLAARSRTSLGPA